MLIFLKKTFTMLGENEPAMTWTFFLPFCHTDETDNKVDEQVAFGCVNMTLVLCTLAA